MRGDMTGLRRDVSDLRYTVEQHSGTLDSLQARMREVETRQAAVSPTPSSAGAAPSNHGPPPGLASASAAFASNVNARREAEEAVVIGAFREGSLKSEINAALTELVRALDEEVRDLVQETFAPGAAGEIGIIKLKASGSPQKPHMWRVFNAFKSMDMHEVLRAKCECILPTSGKLRPRPSKTPEQRLKDREISWTLVAIRQVAEKVGVILGEDRLKMGSAGKVYIDRNLIAIINKDTGVVQWKHDKLSLAGFPAAADMDKQRASVKSEALSK